MAGVIPPLLSITLKHLPEFIACEESRKASARSFLSFLLMLIINDTGNNGDRDILRADNFEESMLMSVQLLATRAVVEVLADGAFVSGSYDRINIATVATNILMSDMRVLWLYLLKLADNL